MSSVGGGLQDKLIDKALYLSLIGAGLVVLVRRRLNWRDITHNNKWLFAYFLYFGTSVLWSDESFVSFKRWIKDFGNVVMVLVVLSEEDPAEAVRAFFARCAYLMIPLSVLVIKYYPGFSRNYDRWSDQPAFVGITTGKNSLGMTLFMCGLSLFWMLLEVYDTKARARDSTALFGYSILIAMTAWLLLKAHSATALVCTILGGGVLLAMRVPFLRNKVRRLGVYGAGVAVLVVVFQASGLGSLVVKELAGLVGRDATLHGRAEIWEAVLNEDINPLIGVGFYSFWSEERNARLSEEWYYELGVAHNGYIETYLNGGLIGVVLLITMIGCGGKAIKREVLDGSTLGALRLAFFVTILMYNITESTFDRLSVVWFTLLLVMMEYPRRLNAHSAIERDEYRLPTEMADAI